MTESPIFIKMADFLAWLLPVVQRFPREQRLVLAMRLHTAAFALHESLVRAGQAETPIKAQHHLAEAVTQLTLLRFDLRLANTLTWISNHHYESGSQRLLEIGALLQAWRRKNDATSSQAVPTAAHA